MRSFALLRCSRTDLPWATRLSADNGRMSCRRAEYGQRPAVCQRTDSRDMPCSGEALRSVKEKTPDICLAAVENDGRAIRLVLLQTPELRRAAVRRQAGALRWMENMPRELALEAVRQDGDTLQLSPNRMKRYASPRWTYPATIRCAMSIVRPTNSAAARLKKILGDGACLGVSAANGRTLSRRRDIQRRESSVWAQTDGKGASGRRRQRRKCHSLHCPPLGQVTSCRACRRWAGPSLSVRCIRGRENGRRHGKRSGAAGCVRRFART